MANESLKDTIIQMITIEKDKLAAYKGLCTEFHIAQNPIPEAIVQAKVETLKIILKNFP